MKVFLVSFIFLISAQLFAQDWQMFPFKQQAYYMSHDTAFLSMTQFDSLIIEDTSTTMYFDTKPHFSYPDSCYSALNESNSTGYYFMDSLIENAGTYYYYYFDYSLEPFVFYTDTTIGTTWNITNTAPYADFDNVNITYDSISTEFIFGIIDSVKYFSVSVDEPIIGEFSINSIKFRLSKSFGMLNYHHFRDLLNPKDCETCYAPKLLCGVINGIDTLGTTVPEWSDYWQLQPGDFLKFYHFYGGYAGPTIYSSALITNVDKFADRVEVNYTDESGVAQQDIFYKAALEYIMEAPDNAITYCPRFVTDISYIDPDDPLSITKFGGVSDEILISNDYIPGTLIIDKTVQAGWHIYDNCNFFPPFEISLYFTFNSYMGLVGESSQGYAEPVSSWGLAGCILSGQVYGNVTPIAINEYANHFNDLLLYPNPTNNVLSFNSNELLNVEYYVSDVNGTSVKDGTTIGNAIDVSNLNAGIYIIKLNYNNQIRISKFIKY